MSGFAGVCELVAITSKKGEFGVVEETEEKRSVRCNVFSMSDAAFYAANAAGYHPEAALQLRRAAYAGEKLVDFNGRRLSVERVDATSPDFVKLTLTEKVSER